GSHLRRHHHETVERDASFGEPLAEGGDAGVVTHVDRDRLVTATANRSQLVAQRKQLAFIARRKHQRTPRLRQPGTDRASNTAARAGDQDGSAVMTHGRSSAAAAAGRKLCIVRSWTCPSSVRVVHLRAGAQTQTATEQTL